MAHKTTIKMASYDDVNNADTVFGAGLETLSKDSSVLSIVSITISHNIITGAIHHRVFYRTLVD